MDRRSGNARPDRNRDMGGKIIALGRVLLFWFATMAVLAGVAPLSAGAGEHSAMVLGAVTVLATFAITLVFVRWEKKSLTDFGFYLMRDTWKRFVAGLLFGLFLVAIHTAAQAMFAPMRWVGGPAIPPTHALLVFATFFLLSAREELAFRGYPLRTLVSSLGPWRAQLVVALLFAAEHLFGGATWTNALLGTGMGSLLFGMAAIATRGLAMPIGLHAAWNFGDWVRGGKGADGPWHIVVEPGAEQKAQFVSMGLYVAIMALAITVLWAWHRHNQKSRSDLSADGGQSLAVR